MPIVNKLKTLGYEETSINEKFKLYVKNYKAVVVYMDKDVYELGTYDGEKGKSVFNIILSKDNDMFTIEIDTVANHKSTRYYIDSSNNLFSADYAVETKDFWLAIGNGEVFYYSKADRKKFNTKIKDNELCKSISRDVGVVSDYLWLILDNKYICMADLMLDIETGYTIRTCGFVAVYENCARLKVKSADGKGKQNLIYSFEHKKLIKIDEIRCKDKEELRLCTGHYIDDPTGKKVEFISKVGKHKIKDNKYAKTFASNRKTLAIWYRNNGKLQRT